jgi:hypothetical protein
MSMLDGNELKPFLKINQLPLHLSHQPACLDRCLVRHVHLFSP